MKFQTKMMVANKVVIELVRGKGRPKQVTSIEMFVIKAPTS
jgi:hypothetical protein